MSTIPTTQYTHLNWNGLDLTLEYQWVGVANSSEPVVVFLHEGLGSIAMWKDFPERFCRENGRRGLVFSRYGYGKSTPRPSDERWLPDYLHRQAHEVLPQLLRQLDIRQPWLFGHSDGGSIALLYAARYPSEVSGIIVVAPHIFVEEVTITGIHAARDAYVQQDVRSKLARYHDDPDSAFWGWNDIWLAPAFRHWNLEQDIAGITCPVLAVQGEDDEYATLEQIRGIARIVATTQLLILPQCGHSPHRDQTLALTQGAVSFMHSATQ